MGLRRKKSAVSLVERSSINDSEEATGKVKVAFFTDILIKDYDGAIKTMYQLINRIPDDRFEYLFFCGVPPKHEIGHRVVKVPSVIIPFNISYRAALPRLAKKRLLGILDEFQPDVIHISTPSLLGAFGLKYAVERHIPVLSIYHTHFISYMRYYFKKVPFLIKPTESLIAYAYKKFYNRCDLVYVPTHLMINELIDYGISGKSLKQWHRGLDTNLFNPGRKDEAYIRSITGNDKPCILYASRIVWEKNIETLFDIYDEAEAQQLDVNFIVAGTGVAEVDARVRMKNAFFMGYLSHSNLGKLYASTDIFIFPSISETYGNVVVEATACGCIPVIARGGGSQALVDDGKTGFLCEPNDAKDYIEKIKLLLSDETLRKKMQNEGRQYISLLSWDYLTEVYFSDIERLTGKHLPEKKALPIEELSI
ncbi:Glycosyltransferase involved in cell wall bisynthesis [Porphyromonadaceae bacterium KH3CP3RA]|nr:Glycosyltransferase involved in cell wall bisynthesis [Porphyromonadaceae bacterium KH3CP3RA]